MSFFFGKMPLLKISKTNLIKPTSLIHFLLTKPYHEQNVNQLEPMRTCINLDPSSSMENQCSLPLFIALLFTSPLKPIVPSRVPPLLSSLHCQFCCTTIATSPVVNGSMIGLCSQSLLCHCSSP